MSAYIPTNRPIVNPITGGIDLGWLKFFDTVASNVSSLPWSSINFAGSSFADIVTRSASLLNAGTVPLARLAGITHTELSASAAIALSQIVPFTKTLLPCGTNPGTGITSGSTVYLSPRGAHATDTSNRVVCATDGVLGNLYCVATGSASVGESFTYTVRLNGADTAIVATISGGSATAASDTTHSVAVVAGDVLNIKLVTSAGASTREHLATVGISST